MSNNKKLAVVTGANAGLGLETSKELVGKYDHNLIFTYRNEAKAKKVLPTIKKQNKNADVSMAHLDLESRTSIDKFAQSLSKKGLKINTLILNGGIQLIGKEEYTELDVEKTFGTNHLGHFYLVNRLWPLLAEDSSIVVTASGTHDPEQKTGIPHPRFKSAELVAYPRKDEYFRDMPDRKTNLTHYSTSKLCNVMFTYELAKRLRELGNPRNVWIGAFDPGLMPGTDLDRVYPKWIQAIWPYMLPLTKLLIHGHNSHTPTTSGKRQARVGSELFKEYKSGSYFEGFKNIKSSIKSYDENAWQDLWSFSEKLLNIKFDPSCEK